MDPRGYLDAAAMTNLRADWIPRGRWDEVIGPGLDSPAQLFARLVRVRGQAQVDSLSVDSLS